MRNHGCAAGGDALGGNAGCGGGGRAHQSSHAHHRRRCVRPNRGLPALVQVGGAASLPVVERAQGKISQSRRVSSAAPASAPTAPAAAGSSNRSASSQETAQICSAAGGFTLVPAAAAPTPTPPPATVAEIGARGNLKDIKVLEKLAELIVKPASDYYAKVRPSSLVFFGCFFVYPHQHWLLVRR